MTKPERSPDFSDRQRERLLEERRTQLLLAERLAADLDELVDPGAPVDSFADDGFGEGAATPVDQDRDRVLHAQARAALEEIDAALRRLEQGGYGVCVSCGRPIAAARLEALPAASLCVACKGGGLGTRRRPGSDRPRTNRSRAA